MDTLVVNPFHAYDAVLMDQHDVLRSRGHLDIGAQRDWVVSLICSQAFS